MTSIAHRNEPINIRALPGQKLLIDKAAAILHKNRSTFMLDAAYQAAEEVLLDQRLFMVNDKEFKAVEKILNASLSETTVNELLKKPAPWEK